MASDIRLGGAYISFRAEDANFNKSVRRTGSGLRRLGAQVDRTARRMRNFNSVAGSLTRTFLPLFGAFGLAEAARRFVELSDTMLLASARLALVSENAEEAANAQERKKCTRQGASDGIEVPHPACCTVHLASEPPETAPRPSDTPVKIAVFCSKRDIRATEANITCHATASLRPVFAPGFRPLFLPPCFLRQEITREPPLWDGGSSDSSSNH